MNRQALIECADLCEQASTYASLTASHANLKPEDAARWCRETEAVLYRALDKLAEAQMPARQPGQTAEPIAEILRAFVPARASEGRAAA